MAGIFNSAIFNNAIFNTGEVAPVTSVAGGAGYPIRWPGKRKRNKTKELFDSIEASIHAMLFGEEAPAPSVVQEARPAPVIDVSQGLDEALKQLTLAAEGYADLSARVANIREMVAQYEAKQQSERDREDDEMMMLL